MDADYDTDDTASEYSEEPAIHIGSTIYGEPEEQNLPYSEEYNADLPAWARRQLGQAAGDTPEPVNLHKPTGKWGQRLAPDGGTYASDVPRESRDTLINVKIFESENESVLVSISEYIICILLQDEIFMGPGNSEFIKEKFQADSQGKVLNNLS